jgi:hypothetical protein
MRDIKVRKCRPIRKERKNERKRGDWRERPIFQIWTQD